METKETKVTKSLPILTKGSSTYKIIIPNNVEKIIRILCGQVWDIEWSGILFYNVTGTFEDNNLEVKCVDILPMDVGSSTYTEFNMSPDVISYMAQNPELLDCKLGLIHSHNKMSTFFSGTDTSTLQEEGNDRNHFVSLIVNNEGKYTAAITRKVSYTSTRDLTYESFNGTVTKKNETIEGEEIQYFMLDVIKEEDNPTQELIKRIEEIKAAKSAAAKTAENTVTKISPYYRTPIQTTQKTLFDNYDDYYGSDYYYYPTNYYSGNKIKSSAGDEINNSVIEKIVNQLITGSVLVTEIAKDAKNKLLSHIEDRFDKRFGNKGADSEMLFEYWAIDFIEYLVWYSVLNSELSDEEMSRQIAVKTINELKKLPKNKYFDKYIEILGTYAD